MRHKRPRRHPFAVKVLNSGAQWLGTTVPNITPPQIRNLGFMRKVGVQLVFLFGGNMGDIHYGFLCYGTPLLQELHYDGPIKYLQSSVKDMYLDFNIK